MGTEFWLDGQRNTLKGVEGDESNPIQLKDRWIVEILRESPAAKASFLRLLPTMLPAEQERLQKLYKSSLAVDINVRAANDRFQKHMNTQNIKTAGPYGGTRRNANI